MQTERYAAADYERMKMKMKKTTETSFIYKEKRFNGVVVSWKTRRTAVGSAA
jgi:hypothetical protein